MECKYEIWFLGCSSKSGLGNIWKREDNWKYKKWAKEWNYELRIYTYEVKRNQVGESYIRMKDLPK